MTNFRAAIRITLASFAATALTLGARAELISYSFDTAGRVTGANYNSGPSTTYQYDAVGNLTRTTTSSVVGDTDNDGMSDAWELQYFGTLARDGSGDFDGDGMSDLAEFLAGTHPLLSASVLRIIRLTPTPGVSAMLEWTSVPGKSYRVQYKNSLAGASWFDLPGDITASEFTASTVDNTLPGIAQRFYRVAVINGLFSPMLTAAQANNQFEVSWPSSTSAGFTLESTTNLSSPAIWTEVTNAASDNGTLKTVIINLDPLEPSRFFRLRQ